MTAIDYARLGQSRNLKPLELGRVSQDMELDEAPGSSSSIGVSSDGDSCLASSQSSGRARRQFRIEASASKEEGGLTTIPSYDSEDQVSKQDQRQDLAELPGICVCVAETAHVVLRWFCELLRHCINK